MHFLTVIKQLNEGILTRDDTLKKAKELFGMHNEELYGTSATVHMSPLLWSLASCRRSCMDSNDFCSFTEEPPFGNDWCAF
jgi:hypothetical protein